MILKGPTFLGGPLQKRYRCSLASGNPWLNVHCRILSNLRPSHLVSGYEYIYLYVYIEESDPPVPPKWRNAFLFLISLKTIQRYPQKRHVHCTRVRSWALFVVRFPMFRFTLASAPMGAFDLHRLYPCEQGVVSFLPSSTHHPVLVQAPTLTA